MSFRDERSNGAGGSKPIPYTPPDAADYLHGDMPKYDTKNNAHIWNVGGQVTNVNALPPFEDYTDEGAGVDDDGVGEELK